MNGGYIMIDCKGLDLTKGTTQEISGLYNRVKDAKATGKPVLAHNCVWGDNGGITPISVMVIDFGTYFICTASTLQVIVTNTDEVTIVNLIQ